MTPHNLLILRRLDAQDSTSSCQKDVAHHGDFSPAKPPSARLGVTLRCHYRPTPTVVRATMASALALGMASAPRCDDREDNEENAGMPVKTDAEAEVKMRVAFTELMQHAVEVPGQQISGILLTGVAR